MTTLSIKKRRSDRERECLSPDRSPARLLIWSDAESVWRDRSALSIDDADFVSLWKEYNDLSTPEGRLVQDADKWEMVHQALAYERAGNQNLCEFWQEYRWHYPVSEEMYVVLVEARRAGGQRASAW